MRIRTKRLVVVGAVGLAALLSSGTACGEAPASDDVETSGQRKDGSSGDTLGSALDTGTAPACTPGAGAALTFTVQTPFELADTVQSQSLLPCMVESVDVAPQSVLMLECTFGETAGIISIVLGVQTALEWASAGDAVMVSYSIAADGALTDAWNWFAIYTPSQELIAAGGSGGVATATDALAPLVVELVDAGCEEEVADAGPCGPYVRGAVRISSGDDAATVIDRTEGMMGTWAIRAGQVVVQPPEGGSCDAGTQGSQVEWFVEPE